MTSARGEGGWHKNRQGLHECYSRGKEVENPENVADIICEWPLMEAAVADAQYLCFL